jgi:hypothetical protein
LLNEKREYENGREECGWWIAYYNPDELERRIENCMNSANHAGETWKWGCNFDLVAASLLYGLNFVSCHRKTAQERQNDGYDYAWEIYCPSRNEMVKTIF